MKTHVVKEQDIEKRWYLVDAEGKVLGRLATRVAQLLRGKHKPIFTPHLDTGDYVVVINAEKVKLTGEKTNQKRYYHFSGYPGGLKITPYHRLMQRHPEQVIKRAVWGMLPHNRLGRKLIKKVKIYTGSEHPHCAQRPEAIELDR